MTIRYLVVLTVVSASSAAAQVPEWVTQIIAAAELPVVAAQARTDGIAADQVRTAIEAMQRSRVRAGEARDVLQEARNAHREHGPVDNFGAFVQSRLSAGLRGRQLAAAIRAEHAARGRGNAGNRGQGRQQEATPRGPGGPGGTRTDTVSQRGGKAGAPARPTQGGRGQTKRPN